MFLPAYRAAAPSHRIPLSASAPSVTGRINAAHLDHLLAALRASYAWPIMSTANEKLQRHLDAVPGLFGRGPVSYDYGKWVDSTHHLLTTLFGEGSSEEAGFLEIVGEGAAARGWGLPLAPDNPWGMQSRLRRAEGYLRDLLGRSEPEAPA